jgi:predicted HTH domain antitoxin
MPPIRTQLSQKRTEQEGRILLAIQAIQNQEIISIHEVARYSIYPNRPFVRVFVRL